MASFFSNVFFGGNVGENALILAGGKARQQDM